MPSYEKLNELSSKISKRAIAVLHGNMQFSIYRVN